MEHRFRLEGITGIFWKTCSLSEGCREKETETSEIIFKNSGLVVPTGGVRTFSERFKFNLWFFATDCTDEHRNLKSIGIICENLCHLWLCCVDLSRLNSNYLIPDLNVMGNFYITMTDGFTTSVKHYCFIKL